MFGFFNKAELQEQMDQGDQEKVLRQKIARQTFESDGGQAAMAPQLPTKIIQEESNEEMVIATNVPDDAVARNPSDYWGQQDQQMQQQQ